MRSGRPRSGALVLAIVLLAVACSGDDGSEAEQGADTSVTSTPTTTSGPGPA